MMAVAIGAIALFGLLFLLTNSPKPSKKPYKPGGIGNKHEIGVRSWLDTPDDK
jgi:hypothetical protein